MPAPFRQACLNCVRAKRRCDLASPGCSRCRLKSLPCEYQTSQVCPSDTSAELLGLDVLGQPAPLSAGMASQQVVENDLSLDLEFSWSPNDLEIDMASFLGSETEIMMLQDINPVSGPPHPWTPGPSGDLMANEDTRSRILYTFERLKLYPKHLVEQGTTSFIHKSSYSPLGSKIMEDVLSACALYIRRNATNETLVFSDLTRKARGIVESASQPWSSPTQHLASVQALVLYQIMRLLDGDIRLRADAERDEAVLLDWTQQLKSRLRPVRKVTVGAHSQAVDLPEYGAHSWRSWIFDESVRRTVILSFTLMALYGAMKIGLESYASEFRNFTFTAQREMWLAPSEYQWNLSRNARKAFAACFGNWDADTADARPSDFEELGVLTVVLTKGLDECSRWLGKDNLVKYGLDSQCGG